MADTLLTLLKNVRSSRRTMQAGEVLFRAGEPAQAMFHVEQGCVRLSRDGVPVLAAEAGQHFAETALFAETYPWDATAAADGAIRIFPKAAMLLLLRAHPDLNLAFSAYLARQADRLRAQAEILLLKGARERVMAFLILAGAENDIAILDCPLTVVAHRLGLTREALYRTLAKLEQEGRLSRPGRRRFRLHQA